MRFTKKAIIGTISTMTHLPLVIVKGIDEFYIVSIFRRHLAVLQWWLETAPEDEAREMGLLLLLL